MTDPQLSNLFAQGTAPESDPVFTRQVAAGIGRARRRSRLVALTLPAAGVLALSGALFVAAGLIRPVLVQLVDGAPQVMGVPAPVVVGVLAAGLALSAWRQFWRSDAGAAALAVALDSPAEGGQALLR